MISTHKICNHKHGGYPYRCSKEVNDMDKCEQRCADDPTCSGFSFGSGDCLLFPSRESCPSDWQSYPGRIASNWNELEEGTLLGYNCKANHKQERASVVKQIIDSKSYPREIALNWNELEKVNLLGK